MTEPGAVDLINLEDADGSRCVVRVTDRFQPGVLTGHDILRADVLTSTEFVDARLELCLSPEDLTAWQHDLTRLAPGTGVNIGGDRGLSLASMAERSRGDGSHGLRMESRPQSLNHVVRDQHEGGGGRPEGGGGRRARAGGLDS
ncbi:DUF5959 family protein [Streptomyces sp. NPDC047024]|uniref:DUF5959 family protein n=1 Tax=Streptomyces sp. NPDC047024 TaxID=3155476 RepID=UPI0033EE7CA5